MLVVMWFCRLVVKW